MRLVFLHLQGYGPFDDVSFSFDSDFSVRYSAETHEIDIRRMNRLPANFFSTDGLPNSIASVSAVVGKNGSGKTSLIRAIFDISALETERKDAFPEGERMENRLPFDYLIVFEQDGKLILFQNMPGHLSGTEEPAPEKYVPLTDEALLVYYSPYYHALHGLSCADGCAYDESTSSLLYEKTGDEKDNTFVDLCPSELFSARELLRIYRLLSEWNGKDENLRKLFRLKLPKHLRISAERGAMSRIIDFVESNQDRDPRYKRLSTMLVSCDAFSNALIAFVSDALDWHYYSERICREPVNHEVSSLEDSLLNVFVALGEKLHFDPDGPMDIPPSDGERLLAYKQALEQLKPLGGAGDLANDRGDYSEGIAMFELLLRQMEKYPELQRCYEIILPSDGDQVLEDVGKVIKLQISSRGFWKTDYLRFGFEHAISSGELTFLSMYARLFRVFKDRESEFGTECDGALVFFDEAETALHPEWQRELVDNTLAFFGLFFPAVKAHLVFASHSPMLISDLPKGNVVFLGGEDVQSDVSRIVNTFGANIFDLYRLSFFMKEGPTGAFAANRIGSLLGKLADAVQSGEKKRANDIFSEDERKTISLIGDPLLRRYFQIRLRDVASRPVYSADTLDALLGLA